MSDPVMPPGTGISVFDDIDSTNAQALRALAEGQSGPHWFVTKSQNAGRGRQGRVWRSQAGNLYASLLIPVTCNPQSIPQLSFVSALGVHDCAKAMLGEKNEHFKLTLKWPNDVLLEGKKLAGILLETSSMGAKPATAVIGIGLNLAHSPQIRDKPTICLADFHVNITPLAALSVLANSMEQRLRQWEQGRNFGKIRDDWLARAQGIGAIYSATAQNRKFSGVFETIATDGALVLRLKGGELHRVTSGEVTPVESIKI